MSKQLFLFLRRRACRKQMTYRKFMWAGNSPMIIWRSEHVIFICLCFSWNYTKVFSITACDGVSFSLECSVCCFILLSSDCLQLFGNRTSFLRLIYIFIPCKNRRNCIILESFFHWIRIHVVPYYKVSAAYLGVHGYYWLPTRVFVVLPNSGHVTNEGALAEFVYYPGKEKRAVLSWKRRHWSPVGSSPNLSSGIVPSNELTTDRRWDG